MLKRIKNVWLLLAVIITASNASASVENRYLQGDDMPNALVFLPLPPDTAMLASNGDYARWIWGKTMRNTPRGEQASWESKYGIVRMCTIYSDVLGIDISEENTPAIYRFMRKAGDTGAGAVAMMKNTYFRKRPFLIMNEPTWGMYDSFEELSKNSSYPSSHTGCGWGTALALAEMAPHMQDTILRRGYEYGISRVIVGAHWQSDVDAAIACASAAIARSHITDDYQADLAAARAEYMQLKGLTESQINTSAAPSAVKILDNPALEDSYFYYGEVAPYWQAKGERDTDRGFQATLDASLNDDDIINGFSSCTGINISNSTMPHVVTLMKVLKLWLGLQASTMKNYWFRYRPYAQLDDVTAVPTDEDTYHDDSSYPSGHAIIGWGLALALTEVMPDHQNEILKRGYDFGWSRVIAGFHYPTDVQAGRVMASCLLTKLHNDTYLSNLLEAAKQEYAAIGTSNNSISAIPRCEQTRHDTTLTALPPDTASTIFAGDFYRWIWGKKMRTTEPGAMAQHDSQCGIDHLCSIYSSVLGIDIGETSTPAIYNIISQTAQTGISSAIAMTNLTSRKKPYELMNEQPWGDNETIPNLSDSAASHPLAHAAMVWSTALTLAQMAPHLQDTILTRAMQCATSGVIAGMCWQSDVDAAITCASAAIAKSRYTADYLTSLIDARNEYMQIKGLTESDLKASSFAAITKILDAPPTLDDYHFVGDLFTYWQYKELRSTERGAQADADEAMNDDYLISTFSECSPVVTISQSETPSIVMLIKSLIFTFDSRATTLKNLTHRMRPCAHFKEPVVYGSEAWLNYYKPSYPSRHAMLGWAIALALTEVMPDCQNAILKRGYDYGESCIIKGTNYASDVMAARVAVACDMSKIHNEPFFKTLLDNAKEEYQRKLDEAGIETIIATSLASDTLWYSITGIIYNTKPTTPGIYIHKGKKVTIQ